RRFSMPSQHSISSEKPAANRGGPIPAGRSVSESSAATERGAAPLFSRKHKAIIGVAAALALLLMVGIVIVAAAVLLSNRLSDKEAVSALENLKTAQRTWWDNEGFAQGAKDPEGAFGRLQDKQRGWWDNEALSNKGDNSGATALSRLEEMQRDWLERENLDKGQPPKDAAGALARLDEVTRKWFKAESVAKAPPRGEPAEENAVAGPANAPHLAD